jgi:hypothetical protein
VGGSFYFARMLGCSRQWPWESGPWRSNGQNVILSTILAADGASQSGPR